MKKMTIVAAILGLAISGSALAVGGGFSGPSATQTDTTTGQVVGGFNGPSATINPTTVEAAKQLADDSRVTLTGYIVQHLRGENYLFKDDTGTINIEIDHKRWRGLTVTPEDKVQIYGEVDKDRDSTEIDVKSIIKVAP
ncbi:YgiW/YdeI family stress tolerance OB fold protein [Zophobihabitans entericus]|uniref:YgiW/YdeI family stress tolerance OB fold protein n=1 Tax=Zophobihabitans entericus TaxID=1635327 RepID=A0A6G9IDM0_9GAMM|nr:YgiW/YdeI family stress tolerance OB fold protein [Zophobihabitans entericus]QIQ21909.1 YgiW/YdeI family stress tolerance OB fold protein [Zophobihabitans entericus]